MRRQDPATTNSTLGSDRLVRMDSSVTVNGDVTESLTASLRPILHDLGLTRIDFRKSGEL